MTHTLIKNMTPATVLTLAALVEYKPGQVVSLTLAQNPSVSMTLFAFSKGEGISTHSAPGDAFVYLLDGEADITIDGKTLPTQTGQAVVMPANTPHGLNAVTDFKMLLVVVNP